MAGYRRGNRAQDSGAAAINSDEARKIDSLNSMDYSVDRQVMRLRRKLEKRDKKISGLKRRIADLEHSLAVKNMTINVTKAVQDALCNVRMIPVLGLGKSDLIIEVKSSGA